MQLTRDQVQKIIKNSPAGVDKTTILDGLITRGYELEGVDTTQAKEDIAKRQTLQSKTLSITSPQTKDKLSLGDRAKEAFGDIKQIGTDIVDSSIKRGENIKEIKTAFKEGEQTDTRSALQTAGQFAGAGADAIGAVFKGAGNILLSDKNEKDVTDVIQKFGAKVMAVPEVQNIINKYNELPETQQRDIDAAGGLVSLVANFVGGAGATEAKNLAVTGAKKTADVIGDTAKATIDTTKNIAKTGIDKVKSINTILEPSVSDAAKVSLNPVKALKGTGQDIDVSVSGKIKKLSELTDDEIEKVQLGTERNVEKFTKQAELFKNNREVKGGSPLEIVGSRTDRAVDIADKKRQSIGKKMAAIEEKYTANEVPISENTLKQFSDVVEFAKNPKYGVKTQNAEVVQKFVDDFDTLNTNGLSVAERTDFVRKWQTYIQDAKDNFGNFKDNATVNTKIQNALNTLKNETVDSIPDKQYKVLRKQYGEYKKLDEIANQLLGKDGLLGERIKGAATIKRAVQSNSDAGARQFLSKLKQITGYDAIKEGDLAITAMDNVGDFQQLSLLGLIQDGKTGLLNKALNVVDETLLGNQKSKTKRYIKK